MTAQVILRSDTGAGEAIDPRDTGLRPPTSPSGKPYSWQLPTPEDPELKALPAAALAERAFVRNAAFQGALERTAAYFVVVSRVNGHEGRDPMTITDDVRTGAVAGFLDIEIDLLGRVLLELQRRGMVSTTDDGNLRIENMAALDQLSEGGATA